MKNSTFLGARDDLSFLDNWESYENYLELRQKKKIEKKNVKLDLWLTDNYPLKISQFLKIFNIFSLTHEFADLIHKFLNEEVNFS